MGTDWSRAREVLCVRLDAMGDVLMTTPALRALRDSAPGRRITLLTSPAGAAIASLVPEIDAVLVFDAPWMKATAPQPDPRADLALVERLRDRRFDAAVIFTVFTQSALPAAYLCHLAGIPLRLAHSRENPYHLLTDWIRETDTPEAPRHEVRRQLDLVAAVRGSTRDERLSLRVPDEARRDVRRLLAEIELDRGSPWALIHPGASAPSRRYDPAAFAAAARTLVLAGWQIVFTGTAAERPLVEEIRAAMGAPSASFAGRLDLAALAALIEAAPVLIGNNSGPAHVAAAVGTPVVELYALTNPQHTPWGVPSRVLFHDVPCRNCFSSVCREGHHDCLRRVPPEAVAAAARELVASSPAGVRASRRVALPVLR